MAVTGRGRWSVGVREGARGVGGSVRRVEVAGRAGPAVAWERYADLAAWPTWAPQISDVEADGRRLAVGRRGTVHVVGGLRVPFVVTAVDHELRTWSWIARLGPVTVTLHHDLAPSADGTVAGLVLEGPTLVVATYGPLTRLPLARLVRA
ncbi:MAG: SRPBCC family protein [Janthinobacterium lividum]